MRGFTLIELLVVIGVIMLITGGIISNYSAYNESERLRQAALTLKNNLRLAQNRAISGEKPDPTRFICTGLIGYTINFTSTNYRIEPQCTEGVVGESISVSLPAGITLAPVPSPFTFGVLTRGTGADVTITLAGQTKWYTIEVSSGGEINDRGFTGL